MNEIVNIQISGIVKTLGFAIASMIFAFAWSPLLTKLLYRFKIWRKDFFDPTMLIEERRTKINTPIMGGLLIVFTVFLITFFFNWDRKFTWVPIGVMTISAILGIFDDLLSVFGKKRRDRNFKQTLALAKVHKNISYRIFYFISLPWVAFKEISKFFGSKRGFGVHVHEKLLLQFAAGGISAWWIYFKLAASWQDVYLPFLGYVSIGFWIIPLIILIVMFTANAVNISDGMDGLAGGMLIPTFGALGFLSWISGYESLAFLNATTAGALIAYTYFNIKPARFQMGDVGSLAMGGLLAINALAINAMAILPFLAFMFYAEAFSVLIQIIGKTIFGKRIFKMAPLHHHFEMSGWNEEKTIMRFWIMHLAMVIIGIWIGMH